MRRIEIGSSSQLISLPVVDDLRLIVAAGSWNALRLRCPIHRFRPGVVQRALQTIAKSFLKCNLQGVVAGVADGSPSVQRGILVVIKAVGRILMAGHVKSRA